MTTYKQFEKMVGGMAKQGLLKQNEAALMAKMQRDPKAVMAQLSKSMDPKMLAQMGGAGNLMELMKGMGGGGAGNPMAELMKQMGGGGGGGAPGGGGRT